MFHVLAHAFSLLAHGLQIFHATRDSIQAHELRMRSLPDDFLLPDEIIQRNRAETKGEGFGFDGKHRRYHTDFLLWSIPLHRSSLTAILWKSEHRARNSMRGRGKGW